jgi:hypothetical protein
MGEKSEEPNSVVVVDVDGKPRGPTAGDVVDATGDVCAWAAGHSSNVRAGVSDVSVDVSKDCPELAKPRWPTSLLTWWRGC